ncbi:MAG: hypothetical protein BGN85_02230 [Alphaproteobacteria bacterium 64-11]|nr:hypothetical protein [Alphaproteobacteria bacterium]OJU12162.1 MAG: hypothetical protein BGN85_02230 [Alphaproteobacteria bacterium 64-11]
MAEPNHCGTCTLCCKLLDIAVLQKPAYRWCPHCKVGDGCGIYAERPVPCREFVCVWLGSQTGPRPLPAELRPDRSGMLFYYTNSFKELNGVTDSGRPGAWRSPKVRSLIRAMAATGRTIIFRDGNGHYGVVNGEPRQIELSEPDEKGARTFVRFL